MDGGIRVEQYFPKDGASSSSPSSISMKVVSHPTSDPSTAIFIVVNVNVTWSSGVGPTMIHEQFVLDGIILGKFGDVITPEFVPVSRAPHP